jgi:putative acetyltransferase
MKFSNYTNANPEPIQKLFKKTFSDSENNSEGELISNLVFDLINKTDPEDLHVFIATDYYKEKEIIIGSAIFSRLGFETTDAKAFLLSPMAIHTDYQKQGIGKKLLAYSHKELAGEGVDLLFTYGDINFYSKSGYKQISVELVKAPRKLTYPKGWLALSLNNQDIPNVSGNSYCVEALNKQVYW